MSTPGEDAQRELERRALRNVRGLVDKMETQDETERRSIKRSVGLIVVVIVVLFGLFWVVQSFKGRPEEPRTVVIPPPANAAK